MSNETDPMDRLNEFLDELILSRQPESSRAGELHEDEIAARQFHLLDGAPSLSHLEAKRIWRNLVMDQTAPISSTIPSSIAFPSATTPTSIAKASRIAKPRRPLRAVELIAAAVILFVFFVGYKAYRQPDSPSSGDASIYSAVTSASPSATTIILLSCGTFDSGVRRADSSGVLFTLLHVQLNIVAPASATPGAAVDYVAAEVELTNNRQDSVLISLKDFRVVDCSGNSTLPSSYEIEPSLPLGSLAPGATTHGWLTFATPSGKQVHSFVYDLHMADGSGATIDCSLVQPYDATPAGGAQTCLISADS